MKQIGIFIADGDPSVLRNLTKEFRQTGRVNVIGTALDGKKALRKIEKYIDQIDIVITNLYLPLMDGYSLVLQIKKRTVFDKLKGIIMTSEESSLREEELALNCGVEKFMLGPVPFDHLMSGVSKLYSEVYCFDTIEEKISDTLHQFGISPHLKGFAYLKESILMTYNLRTYDCTPPYSLYVRLQIIFKDKPSCIERSIRNAIEMGMKRMSAERIDKYFGYILRSGRKQPANREYIAILTDLIKTEPLSRKF